MADAEVTINDQTEGASTANVDTKSMVGVGGKTVHRQVVTLGDNTTFGQTATVTAGSALKVDNSAVTQPISNANLDAAVSTLATQATLALIKAKTDNLDVALSTLEISEVTNSGTFAVQDSEKLADNAGFTDGTTKVLPVGYIYDEVAGTALTENDIAAARINVNRAAVSTLEDGTTRGRYATVTAANALKVDNSAVTQPVSIAATVATDPIDDPTRDNGKIDIAAFDVQLPTGTNNIGDVDILTIAAGDNNIGNVDIVTMPNVAQSTAANLKNEPAGNVADAAGDSGNPIKIGGVGRTTNRTAVTDGQRVNATYDDLGRQVVVLHNVRDLIDTAVNAAAITNTTETTIVAATASTFHDVVAIVISNSSAVATLVQIRDTTAGTVIMNIYSPAGSTVGVSLPHPIPQATVNTNWTAQAITTASSLFVTMQYISNV